MNSQSKPWLLAPPMPSVEREKETRTGDPGSVCGGNLPEIAPPGPAFCLNVRRASACWASGGEPNNSHFALLGDVHRFDPFSVREQQGPPMGEARNGQLCERT
jgi:hypothetical protein